MTQAIHVVTRFDSLGGTEAHAHELAVHLTKITQTRLWGTQKGKANALYGATVIDPFNGRLPKGGVLIFVGTHFDLGLWLDYVKPQKVVVICNKFSMAQTFRFMCMLERPSLPKAELAYISRLVKEAVGLPGRVSPTIIDLDRFQPKKNISSRTKFTIGRHSREDITKHHPDDTSLYRLLAWQGIKVKIMGGECLYPALLNTPLVNISAAGSMPSEHFLQQLDCFFYRTASKFPEAGGRVVLEALASGLPTIAHSNGGYAEWIKHGINGFLFKTQEEAFDLLISQSKQPERHQMMSLAARDFAEKHCKKEKLSDYFNWLIN